MSPPEAGPARAAGPALDEALARIARLDARLHAFVAVTPVPGGPGALAHWTLAVKDNLGIAGAPLGAGAARPLYTAQWTAPAVARLLAAGAALVGRTHMVEHAFGGWGLNAAQGAPRNPHDAALARVAGGSSSGSAVAVAAGLARIALGTDTAGSVRMPAALCGVTGYKPSFGRWPAEGSWPLAPSYDSVGLLARSAADCAAVDAVLAGAPADGAGEIAFVRLDRAAWPVPVEPATAAAVEAAAEVAAEAAAPATLPTVAPPFDLADLMRDAGMLISAEAWQVHRARFEAAPQAYGEEMQRRLAAARALDARAVAAARDARAEAARRFDAWMAGHGAVLLLPAVPCSAPPMHAVRESGAPSGVQLGAFVRWVNHVGGCAISLPAGVDADGLPVAVQLVARGGDDARLLRAAMALQARGLPAATAPASAAPLPDALPGA